MLVLGVSWNLRGWSGSAAFQVLEARYGASQRQLGRGLRAVQRIPPCKTRARQGQGRDRSIAKGGRDTEIREKSNRQSEYGSLCVCASNCRLTEVHNGSPPSTASIPFLWRVWRTRKLGAVGVEPRILAAGPGGVVLGTRRSGSTGHRTPRLPG